MPKELFMATASNKYTSHAFRLLSYTQHSCKDTFLHAVVVLITSHIGKREERGKWSWGIKHPIIARTNHTFLGLLAKIKCSICSYQFNIWYVGHRSHDIKFISWGGEPITIACYWGSWASPMRCTKVRAWRTPPNQVQILSGSIKLPALCSCCEKLTFNIIGSENMFLLWKSIRYS